MLQTDWVRLGRFLAGTMDGLSEEVKNIVGDVDGVPLALHAKP